MPLRNWMTELATTTRDGAMIGEKSGAVATHLENVKVMPVQLPDSQRVSSIRPAIGLAGGFVQEWESFTEKHQHTDNGIIVNQIPDILSGDMITIDSTTYKVRTAETNSLTSSFGKTLVLVLIESRRE